MSQIGLLDCNNFFVSCERLFRPDLVEKPVAVLSSNDGCIVARSEEVKALGIPMGVPYFKVKDVVKEHGVTLFSGNLTLYRDISTRVMETLTSEVGECEIYSIDEAFFAASRLTTSDITDLQRVIARHVGVPVSIGVAATKTLAKVASELEKRKSGICVLTSELWQNTAKDMKCGAIWGIGRRLAERLYELRVETVDQFMALERGFIDREFGVAGVRIYDELHGTPTMRVDRNSTEVRQSISSSRSFSDTTHVLGEIESAVAYHIDAVMEKVRAKKLIVGRVYVSLRASRYSDFAFRKGSAEVILTEPTSATQPVLQAVLQEVRRIFDSEIPYKKVGVTLGGLMPQKYQTDSLFSTAVNQEEKQESSIDDVTDMLNRRFGRGTIQAGVVRASGPRTNAQLKSASYTTAWSDIPLVKAT